MGNTNGARRKGFPYGKVYQPRDFGDERVLTVDEAAEREPIPPSEPMPDELQHMLEPNPATWYVESDDPPEVELKRKQVGQGPHGAIWELEVDAGGLSLWKGRPGLSQSTELSHNSETVEELGYATSPPQDEPSYRPPWVRTEFRPRVALSGPDRAAPVLRPRDASMGSDPLELLGWPWHCTGKVLGGFDTDFDHPITVGSGVLVGRRVLLTAAHLAMWNRPPGTWWMRFFPGWHDGPSSKLGSSFVEAFRGPGPQSTPNPNDFVVCKLYQPLGSPLGHFGVRWSSDDDFYEDQRWWSIGYPDYEYSGDRAVIMVDIEVRDIDDDGDGREIEIGLTNYLLNGGWSGGPMWGFLGDDPRVIGVCSGHESDGWDPQRAVFAGGGPLVTWVRAARSDWG